MGLALVHFGSQWGEIDAWAPTAYTFTCSAMLIPLARSTALIRLPALPRCIYSLAPLHSFSCSAMLAQLARSVALSRLPGSICSLAPLHSFSCSASLIHSLPCAHFLAPLRSLTRSLALIDSRLSCMRRFNTTSTHSVMALSWSALVHCFPLAIHFSIPLENLLFLGQQWKREEGWNCFCANPQLIHSKRVVSIAAGIMQCARKN